jgi:hypothetical protein
MRFTFILLFVSFCALSQSNDGLRFIQNKGQWDEKINFQARVPGGRIGVSAKGFSIMLLDMQEMEKRHLATHGPINESDGHESSEPINGHYFEITLGGSNQNATPQPEQVFEGYHNYFLGSDSCKWASNALAYRTIVYKNVYQGIDFRVSSVGNNLKYDFIVQPEADPSQIRIEYKGVDRVEKLNEVIQISTSVGMLTELKPISYQDSKDSKYTVPSEYRLQDNAITFSFPSGYDPCKALTIDPLLIFSTYSGSSADNWGSTATPGERGTLYSAGVTHQQLGGAFPATPGAFQTVNKGNFDMAVIKYDSAGTRFLYATHLGGLNNDSPVSLVVDKTSNDLIVLGLSGSSDYPTRDGSFDKTFNGGTAIFNRVLNTNDQWDIVVTRLPSTGNRLIGSTFLGGSGNDGLNQPKQSGGPLVANYGDEMRGDVITDNLGNVYISSVTGSNNFPIINGFDNSFNGGITDGVVVKMSPDLSAIIWSSYLGGAGFDAAYSIKFDHDNNVLLAGGTSSVNFPVTTGAYQTTFKGIVDGWIARISSDGTSVMQATFTGTNSFDQVYFIDLNASGNIYCYGQTAGQMPITSGVYKNINSGQFLQKLSADLSRLEFSTVFGSGSGNGIIIPNISPTAFLVNDCDNIYMAGWGGFVNSSPNTGFWQSSTFGMPVTEDAYQKTTSGSDFYFMVLNGDATQLVYATYLGGSSSKTHVDGGTSRFDKFGIVYHAVCSGCGFGNTTGLASSDFPTTPNAKSRLNGSQNCNNAAFKFDLSSLRANFQTNSVKFDQPGFNNVCFPDTVVFENLSTGGRTIRWNLGDGTIIDQTSDDPRTIMHQYKATGNYPVKLRITDLSTCSQTDSITKVVNYFRPEIVVGQDAVVCEGQTHQLTASGAVTYRWTSSIDKTFTSNQASPFIQPKESGFYFVTASDANGCTKKDTVTIGVNKNVRAAFQTYDLRFTNPGYNNVCYPEEIRFKNLSFKGENYVWTFDDGTRVLKSKTDTASLIHGFKQQGIYRVKLKAINNATCNKADSIVKIINYFKNNVKAGNDATICEGTSYTLSAPGASLYDWFNSDRSFVSTSPTPVVQPKASTEYFVNTTDANGCKKKDTIVVTVLNKAALKWQYRIKGNCLGRPTVFVQNQTEPEEGFIYRFDFGDGFTSTENELEYAYKEDGTFRLRLIGLNKFCPTEEGVSLPMYTLFVPNVITPENSLGANDTFEIRFGPTLLMPTDVGIPIQLTIMNRWGSEVFQTKDYKNDWDANGLAAGVYFFELKVGDLATCKSWIQVIK